MVTSTIFPWTNVGNGPEMHPMVPPTPWPPRLEAALKEAVDSGLMEEEMVAAKVQIEDDVRGEMKKCVENMINPP